MKHWPDLYRDQQICPSTPPHTFVSRKCNHDRLVRHNSTRDKGVQWSADLHGMNSIASEMDHWRNYWDSNTFWELMSHKHYKQLKAWLHFSNNNNRVPRGQPEHHPLFKIAPILNLAERANSTLYTPQKTLSLDERMQLWKGKFAFNQYNPNKPIKWGMKAFCLCESSSGYCIKHEIYTGETLL